MCKLDLEAGLPFHVDNTRHSVLTRTVALKSIRFCRESLEAAHPGPPFFRIDDLLGHPAFQVEINGKRRRLAHVGYHEHSSNAFWMVKDGSDRQVFVREAQIADPPFSRAVWHSQPR
jgi:hypothetical protein